MVEAGSDGRGGARGQEVDRRQADLDDVRPNRTANAIDRYSLALQLIQVCPMVANVAAFLVSPHWLGILLSGVGLLAATVWAFWAERSTRARQESDEVPALRAIQLPQQFTPSVVDVDVDSDADTDTDAVPIAASRAVARAEISGEPTVLNIFISVNQPTRTPRHRSLPSQRSRGFVDRSHTRPEPRRKHRPPVDEAGPPA